MPDRFLIRLTAAPQVGPDIYVATVLDPNLHPEHPIFYPPGIWGPTDPRPGWGLPGDQPRPEHPIFYPPGIWGPPGPWPTPPIHIPGGPDGSLPPPTAQWRFQDDGWYFVAGPLARPVPIPPNNNFDPIKSGWKYLNGWFFVSGPYDKPFPIFGVKPPDIEEPPEQTPADGDWVYRDDGWYFTYGPLPKPAPPGGGVGGNAPGKIAPE